MNDTIKKYKKGNYTAEIFYDEYSDSPRDGYILSQIVSFANGYNFSDNDKYKRGDFETWQDLAEQIKKDEDVLEMYSLYIYEHSAIKLSITSFNDRFDSGNIGFIYVTRSAVSEMFGDDYTAEDIKSAVESELDIYNSYINGEVYRVQIFELTNCDSCGHSEDEELEVIDISYTFYDLDEAIESAKAEISRHDDTESEIEEVK